jgi:hypothetical protein
MRAGLILATVWLLPRLSSGQAIEGSVSGTVRDETGQPVRDALVVIGAESEAPLRVRTSGEGLFRFLRVPVGRRDLQVVRLGFRPHRAFIDVIERGIELAITLERAPVLLDTIAVRATRPGLYGVVATRGMELLPHAPRPLRGAIVEVIDQPYRATTDVEGRFRIEQLREGSYSLLVRIDRYQSRMVSVYVPPEGGVDVSIVLDSTVAEYQRRDDFLLRDMSRRLREASNPSALVGLHELVAPEGTTLKDALRVAPSALSRGLIVKDDVTCLYVNGDPRPGLIASDILASEVQAVELYGTMARGNTIGPPKPWLLGTFCGTGPYQGPGRNGGRSVSYNIARVLVIWTKRRR